MPELKLMSFTQNMTEAEVIQWLVKDGESVDNGQEVVEVESEKATKVISAPESGTISIEIESGERAEVGETLARLESPLDMSDSEPSVKTVADEKLATKTSGKDTTSDAPSKNEGSRSTDINHEASSRAHSMDKRVRASPAARNLVREMGIDKLDILQVEGSGPDGALLSRDIRGLADEIREFSSGLVGKTEPNRAIYERREGSKLRKAVASQMVASSRNAPQVTVHRAVPVDELLEIKTALERDLQLETSITDFLIAAVAQAKSEHPDFNAIYEDGKLHLADNVNVGVAVNLDDGLVVPVLMNADHHSLFEISDMRSRLVRSVQDREHTQSDLSDGTFTITNLGHFGVEKFDPLLNVPEVAILGVGSIERRCVEGGQGVLFESKLPLSLTFDHRALDGADAAGYLDTLETLLGHPLRLLPIE